MENKAVTETCGFVLKACRRFFAVDPYGERYIVFSDYAKYFREEHGIEFSDEVLNELLSIEEQNEDKRLRKVQFDVIEKMLRNSHPEALEHLKINLGI